MREDGAVTDCKWLRCVRWEKWQSYRRDRGQPPWIKLHRRLLRSLDWLALDDRQRGQLVGIWMLAADHDGFIPSDSLIVKRLAAMDTVPDLKFFQDKGWLESGARVTPKRRRRVAPEQNRIEKTGVKTPSPDEAALVAKLAQDLGVA
ncbi:MAG: hypothetical protein WC120_05185 [Parcubacteria group bacterium]